MCYVKTSLISVFWQQHFLLDSFFSLPYCCGAGQPTLWRHCHLFTSSARWLLQSSNNVFPLSFFHPQTEQINPGIWPALVFLFSSRLCTSGHLCLAICCFSEALIQLWTLEYWFFFVDTQCRLVLSIHWKSIVIFSALLAVFLHYVPGFARTAVGSLTETHHGA